MHGKPALIRVIVMLAASSVNKHTDVGTNVARSIFPLGEVCIFSVWREKEKLRLFKACFSVMVNAPSGTGKTVRT